jgi:hypothetical protein
VTGDRVARADRDGIAGGICDEARRIFAETG